jgi:transcriptional regulator with XRE-family HTH domain
MALTMGQRIKIARIKNRMTQVRLAERVGISTTALSQIENDESTNPRLSTLLGLADTLGVSLDYLVGRKDAEQTEPADADLVHG